MSRQLTMKSASSKSCSNTMRLYSINGSGGAMRELGPDLSISATPVLQGLTPGQTRDQLSN